MPAFSEYKLTPAASEELEKILDDFRNEIITNAHFMNGKSSFSKEDILKSRKRLSVSGTLLRDKYTTIDSRDVGRSTAFGMLVTLKLSLALVGAYVYIPLLNNPIVMILACVSMLIFCTTLYIAYNIWNARTHIMKSEKLAGTLVWQWSAIEALSTRLINPSSGSSAHTISVFEFLDHEFSDTHTNKQLKEILKARNNIVNYQQIEVRKAKKLIKAADEIIRHLRNRTNGS